MTVPLNAEETRDVSQLIAVAVAALLVGVLDYALPDRLTIGPSWLVLALVAVLLLPVCATIVLRKEVISHHILRLFTFAMLALLTLALIGSLVLLVINLPFIPKGIAQLRPAAILWPCNVLIFGIWYWEIDGNGPRSRRKKGHVAADFRFPQQDGNPHPGWAPGFIDYLFVAFCFATALSPADTLPLTRRAKLMMMAEAVISMLVLVLIVSRSVNII